MSVTGFQINVVNRTGVNVIVTSQDYNNTADTSPFTNQVVNAGAESGPHYFEVDSGSNYTVATFNLVLTAVTANNPSQPAFVVLMVDSDYNSESGTVQVMTFPIQLPNGSSIIASCVCTGYGEWTMGNILLSEVPTNAIPS